MLIRVWEVKTEFKRVVRFATIWESVQAGVRTDDLLSSYQSTPNNLAWKNLVDTFYWDNLFAITTGLLSEQDRQTKIILIGKAIISVIYFPTKWKIAQG